MLRKVEPIVLGCDVRIRGDQIVVTGLSLHDAELAAYVGEHPEVDRPGSGGARAQGGIDRVAQRGSHP
jgi:hypothetical protein